MTRILFLDFDGVVRSQRNFIVGESFDVVALKMIEQLQKVFEFLIVISSTERINIKDIEQFQQMLNEEYSVNLKFHPVWKTPNKVDGTKIKLPIHANKSLGYWRKEMNRPIDPDYKNIRHWRGFEIQSWLNDNVEGEVDFLVVDDSRDLFPIKPSNVVLIKKGELRGGLQLRHYDKIWGFFERRKVGRGKPLSSEAQPAVR